jgi:uroporphyrin-3 C-methyltransferase
MAAPTEDSNNPSDKTSAKVDARDLATGNNAKVADKYTAASAPGDTAKKKSTKARTPVDRRQLFNRLVSGFSLLLVLLVAGATYKSFKELQSKQADDQLRDQKQQAMTQQLSSELGQLQQAHAELQKQLQSADLAQKGMALELEKVAKLAEDRGKTPVYWRVAEVEYLLKVANSRVRLEHDANTALTALSDADQRLKAEGDPGLIPIRQQITAEINALRGVQNPDIAGLSLQLNELVARIKDLPLIGFKLAEAAVDTPTTKAADWRELPKALWQDILSLVVIRHREQPIEPMLPPDQQQYLAQNLSLKLEQSRLALLRRDTAVFRRNLVEAQEWIERYFDKEATAVQQVQTQLSQLASVELQPVLPDISGSLRGLRAWLTSQTQAKQAQRGGPA